MNIGLLGDRDLLKNTKDLVHQEQKLTVSIIEHLTEIDRRRLYADLKYPSLWEYCIGELGYSKAQSFRRIDAMRMAREVPSVKEKLASGLLTLSAINLAAEFCREAELKSPDKKEEIINSIQGKSKREAEKKIAEIKIANGITNNVPRREIKSSSDNEIRLHLTLKKDTYAKLQKIKGLLAHSNPNITTEELLNLLADDMIMKVEAKKFAIRKTRTGNNATDPRGLKIRKITAETNTIEGPNVSVQNEKKGRNTLENSFLLAQQESDANIRSIRVAKKSRYIPARVKRAVYLQHHGQCANCGSSFAGEIDHKISFARGGKNSKENLQLLCRNCNQRKAIIEFGQEKMFQFQ